MSEHDDHHAGIQVPDQSPLSPCPQQLQPPQQQLPNEILCYIIDQWCSQDFFILRSLLYVNKLFFHAAAPHLWSRPFTKWGLNCHRNELGFMPDRDKLMDTMFASFLEARLLEQEQQELEREKDQEQGQGQKLEDSVHGSRKTVRRKSEAQRVDDILKPFGLRIAKAVQSPFLRRYLKDKHHDHTGDSDVKSNGSQDTDSQRGQGTPIQADNTTRKTMTINYSKYFGSITLNQWFFVNFNQLIHLRSALPETRSLFIPSIDHSDGNANGSDEEEGHDHLNQHIYQLPPFIASLLFYYNSENITDFELNIELAPKCLAFAPKMAKLRQLCLQRSEAMPDSHLESMILFIGRNMEAFPRKPPLKLIFGYGWYSYKRNFDGFIVPATDHSQISTLANETAAMGYMRRERGLQSRAMKSKIALWEAVHAPHIMTISKVPGFYEQAQNIQLDRLQGLTDEDVDRFEYGEGSGMQAFLRKCNRIWVLALDIGSKDVFSWAAEEALIAADQPTSILSELLSEAEFGHEARLSYPVHDPLWSPVSDQPRKSGILPDLETLCLNSDRPYRLLIHALNDAMVAFASSLRTISVRASSGLQIPNDWHPASILARRRARLSMPLYNVPWANTIGRGVDFLPFPLPHLKTLSVYLHRVASVQIGSLAQCPNLENLRIEFGNIVVSEMHPDDRVLLKPSSSIPITPENMGDMRYQQARIDRSLFPVWNLPHLQTLVLEDLAAMRFDIQSLYSMQCLKTLELYVKKKKAATWCKTKEYAERQTSAWKNKYYDAFSHGNGSQGDDNTRIHPGERTGANKERSRFELRRWSFPKLKSLSLSGPPATMFYLEWLRDCPNLEELRLKIMEPNQHITRLPRFALPWMSPSPLPVLEDSHEQGLDEDHSNSDCNQRLLRSEPLDEHPLLHSRLKDICFEGPWNMSDEDLLSLLTIYAPCLDSFRADRLNDRSSSSGYRFLKTVMEADRINRAYVESITALGQGAENAAGKQGQPSMLGANMQTVGGRKMTLTKRNREILGLKMINDDDAYDYRVKELRVYVLLGQRLVSPEDYRMIKEMNQAEGGNNPSGSS